MMTRKTWFQLAVLPVFALLAVGSSSPKKDGASTDKAATTTTTAGSLGTAVTVGETTWTIIDVVNRGSKMKANESFEKDATTAGSFVQIHFKIVNNGKTEGTMADSPKLVDQGGREFGTFEKAYSFRPKDSTGIFLEKVQPSMSKEFYEIYEVPTGVTTLSFKARDFNLFGDSKVIALGALPAPAPAPAAPAAAPTATAKGGGNASASGAKGKTGGKK